MWPALQPAVEGYRVVVGNRHAHADQAANLAKPEFLAAHAAVGRGASVRGVTAQAGGFDAQGQGVLLKSVAVEIGHRLDALVDLGVIAKPLDGVQFEAVGLVFRIARTIGDVAEMNLAAGLATKLARDAVQRQLRREPAGVAADLTVIGGVGGLQQAAEGTGITPQTAFLFARPIARDFAAGRITHDEYRRQAGLVDPDEVERQQRQRRLSDDYKAGLIDEETFLRRFLYGDD